MPARPKGEKWERNPRWPANASSSDPILQRALDHRIDRPYLVGSGDDGHLGVPKTLRKRVK